MTEAVASNQAGLKAEISDFKRRRIREEACHLFYKHGYESTTLDAIAAALNVTKPFIYGYYKNKSELLMDICSTGISLSLAALDEPELDKRPHSDKLRRVVERITKLILRYQEYIVVYVREEKNLEADQARFIRKQRNAFDHKLADILLKGQKTGEFCVDDPLMTANTIGGMLTWVSLWFVPGGNWSETEISAHLMRMVSAITTHHSMEHAYAP